MSSKMQIPKICQMCGKEFIARTTKTMNCSTKCAQKAYKERQRNGKIQSVVNVAKQRISFQESKLIDKEFLSIKETSDLLGTSRMTIHRQIKNGNLKAARLGTRVIIKRTEINKLFEL